jgi:hypothetical protein
MSSTLPTTQAMITSDRIGAGQDHNPELAPYSRGGPSAPSVLVRARAVAGRYRLRTSRSLLTGNRSALTQVGGRPSAVAGVLAPRRP